LYVIGIDYGTLSGRAVLVDVEDGTILGEAVYDYPHGVMTRQLPHLTQPLPPDWALQHPQDYLDVLYETIPVLLQESGIDKADVVGIGVDFTSSTILPTTADGVPLCFLDKWRDNPHAWVKLWKHHAANLQAKRIEALARAHQVAWLDAYGGNVSAEFFMSKALQICDEAPELYQQMARLIEAGDWVVWQLSGQEARSIAMAGYKAFYQDGQFPSSEFFAQLNPNFSDVAEQKIGQQFFLPGTRAGGLTEAMAQKLGLEAGIAISVAQIDAHASAPALEATEAGIMTLVMGTSTCHIIASEKKVAIDGVFGIVEHGILPDLYGYEAGQSAVGDIFAWFVDHMVPQLYFDEADKMGCSVHDYLEQQAEKQSVGEHGLVALDWWNGNRSTLMNANLSGTILGLNLHTTAPDIYRALIEATAFGTRRIIESYEANGIYVHQLVAAGGLPQRNHLLRQIYADVIGRDIQIPNTTLSSAIGAAIFASLAADVYDNLHDASQAMGHRGELVIRPDPQRHIAYNKLYKIYRQLYDYFGENVPSMMAELKQIRRDILER
jgi:L-ribulokinase